MIKSFCITAFIFILTFENLKAFAQADEAAVKQTINNLFTGMKNTDTALVRASFALQPVFQTIVKNKEGKIQVVTEALDSFIVAIGAPHKEIYDERISFDVIRIDGDLAIVWAPYKFYVGDSFHHCGADSFQLVKIDGLWKIQYLIDTRRKNCE